MTVHLDRNFDDGLPGEHQPDQLANANGLLSHPATALFPAPLAMLLAANTATATTTTRSQSTFSFDNSFLVILLGRCLRKSDTYLLPIV